MLNANYQAVNQLFDHNDKRYSLIYLFNYWYFSLQLSAAPLANPRCPLL